MPQRAILRSGSRCTFGVYVIKADDGRGDGEKGYVCTPFNDPINNSPLVRMLDDANYKALYCQRALVGMRAASAYRQDGTTSFEMGFGYFTMPKFNCTTLSSDPDAKFQYNQLSFTFELFEHDGARRRRERWLNEFSSDSPYLDADGMPKTDYLTKSVRDSFAAPPHFAMRYVFGDTENLIWTASVRGDEKGVRAGPSRSASGEKFGFMDNGSGRIVREQTVPIDSGMDDYVSNWTKPYRLVVSRYVIGLLGQIV